MMYSGKWDKLGMVFHSPAYDGLGPRRLCLHKVGCLLKQSNSPYQHLFAKRAADIESTVCQYRELKSIFLRQYLAN